MPRVPRGPETEQRVDTHGDMTSVARRFCAKGQATENSRGRIARCSYASIIHSGFGTLSKRSYRQFENAAAFVTSTLGSGVIQRVQPASGGNQQPAGPGFYFCGPERAVTDTRDRSCRHPAQAFVVCSRSAPPTSSVLSSSSPPSVLADTWPRTGAAQPWGRRVIAVR